MPDVAILDDLRTVATRLRFREEIPRADVVSMGAHVIDNLIALVPHDEDCPPCEECGAEPGEPCDPSKKCSKTPCACTRDARVRKACGE